MKINKEQEAYLSAREYALLKRDNESTKLMLIAQENLLKSFLSAVSDFNTSYRRYSSEYIMNFTTEETRLKFTNLALKYKNNE